MRVTVKLMGSLRDKLPREAKAGTVEVEVPDGANIVAVLATLDIATTSVHVVMVNDAMEPDRERPLAGGDSLVVLPPVAGG